MPHSAVTTATTTSIGKLYQLANLAAWGSATIPAPRILPTTKNKAATLDNPVFSEARGSSISNSA